MQYASLCDKRAICSRQYLQAVHVDRNACAWQNALYAGRERGRALAGRGASESGLHWDERKGKQQLEEMMGRMQGPREPLERLVVISPGVA
jgi:hypothetical protein